MANAKQCDITGEFYPEDGGGRFGVVDLSRLSPEEQQSLRGNSAILLDVGPTVSKKMEKILGNSIGIPMESRRKKKRTGRKPGPKKALIKTRKGPKKVRKRPGFRCHFCKEHKPGIVKKREANYSHLRCFRKANEKRKVVRAKSTAPYDTSKSSARMKLAQEIRKEQPTWKWGDCIREAAKRISKPKKQKIRPKLNGLVEKKATRGYPEEVQVYIKQNAHKFSAAELAILIKEKFDCRKSAGSVYFYCYQRGIQLKGSRPVKKAASPANQEEQAKEEEQHVQRWREELEDKKDRKCTYCFQEIKDPEEEGQEECNECRKSIQDAQGNTHA